MGTCHIINVRNIYLGAYLGVGAFCSSGKNGYLGAYPRVGYGSSPMKEGHWPTKIFVGRYLATKVFADKLLAVG